MTGPVICATGIWTPPVKEIVSTSNGERLRKEPGKLTPWRDNAELIARGVVGLGWLTPDDNVLDTTYGGGVWWNDFTPPRFTYHDIEIDGVDFRELPHPDNSFDVVAFDPPYVCTGGRETSTIGKFNKQYGLDKAPRTPEALAEMNDAGLAECFRVTRGLVLAKTANYVWSGKLFMGAHRTVERALALGFKVEDSFVHTGTVRMQPERTRKCGSCDGAGRLPDTPLFPGDVCDVCEGSGRVASGQHHARQNVSYLYVLRKPRR